MIRKGLLATLVFTMLLGFLFTREANAEDELQAMVTPRSVERIYIYTGPGTNYPLLGTLKKGYFIRLCDETLYWYKVCLDDGRSGWVFSATANKVYLPVPKAPVAAPFPGDEDDVIEIEPDEVIGTFLEGESEDEELATPDEGPKVEQSKTLTARYGFQLAFGAGPGPMDLFNDPEIVASFQGYTISGKVAYDFAPLPAPGMFPVVLGLQAGVLFAQTEETDDIVQETQRAERWGDIAAEMLDISLAFRITPVSTQYVDLTFLVGPSYYQFLYYQRFDQEVIVDGQTRADKGLDTFYERHGIGYLLGSEVSVYPFAGSTKWVNGFLVRLELRFTHASYAIEETSDHEVLIDEIVPKLMYSIVSIGYQF